MEENIGENNFENMADNLEVKKCEHSRLMRQKADADSYIANIKAKIKEVNEEISKRMTVVEKKLREAEEICPERVNSDKSPVEVQKLLESE